MAVCLSDQGEGFKSLVMPLGPRVQYLRTDKGGEDIGPDFEGYCLSTGVVHQFAEVNTPYT